MFLQRVTVAESIKRPVDELPERELYEMLCRGEVSLPVEKTSQLKCMYIHNNNAFLKLAPFKIEEAYLKPRIVIFHEIMYDNEIETIKKMAQPRVSLYKDLLNSIEACVCTRINVYSCVVVSPSYSTELQDG